MPICNNIHVSYNLYDTYMIHPQQTKRHEKPTLCPCARLAWQPFISHTI